MLAELAREFGDRRGERLSYLYVSLSNVCNAACSYCDVHEIVPQRGAFNGEDLVHVLTEAQQMGCTMVHFMGGGEPLVARDFLPAVLACTRLRMGIAVTTNGSHLAARVNVLPSETSVRLVILSLDSHHATVHDRVRRFPGLFGRAISGVNVLRVRHPEALIVLNHVVTTDNIGEVEGFVRFASTVGANAVNFIPVKDMPSLTAKPDQAAALADRWVSLEASAQEVGVELLCDPLDALAWATEQAGGSMPSEYRCVFPEHALYLDLPTGRTFPCDCTVHRKPEERFMLGNVWTDGLQAIWQGEQIARLRSVLASPCDPGCKAACDWNNRRTNRVLRGATGPELIGTLR